MNSHHVEMTAVSVGALVGVGKFLHDIEPVLADLSYLLAVVTALVTIYYKIRNKGQ
jgi:hypothetical protein